jgi:hypothetical protein
MIQLHQLTKTYPAALRIFSGHFFVNPVKVAVYKSLYSLTISAQNPAQVFIRVLPKFYRDPRTLSLFLIVQAAVLDAPKSQPFPTVERHS